MRRIIEASLAVCMLALMLWIYPILAYGFVEEEGALPRCLPGRVLGLDSSYFEESDQYFLWRDYPYDWVDATDGENLNLEHVFDSELLPVDEDFLDNFQFAGGSLDGILVHGYGVLQFDEGFNRYIDVYNFPLMPESGTSSNVYWKLTGNEPNRTLVVQWNHVRIFDAFGDDDDDDDDDSTGVASCQALLHESTGDIVLQYQCATNRGYAQYSTPWEAGIGIRSYGDSLTASGDDDDDDDDDDYGRTIDNGVAVLFTYRDGDEDGLPDAYESALGMDEDEYDFHWEADDDNDGLSNFNEAYLGTDPNNRDTDGDGLDDGDEWGEGAEYQTEPLCADTDFDCLPDGLEANELGTDPNLADTDGDLLLDGKEIELGTDPLTPTGEEFWEGAFTDLEGGDLYFDYYVDQFHGSNENDGTDPLAPLQTIAAAIAAAVSDTDSYPVIYIGPGTYHEWGWDLGDFGGVILYGCATNATVIDADNNTCVYLGTHEGSWITNLTIRCASTAVELSNCGYCTVSNVKITGVRLPSDYVDADWWWLWSWNGPTLSYIYDSNGYNNTYDNCRMEDCGVGIYASDSLITVRHCRFTSINYPAVDIYNESGFEDYIRVTDNDAIACGGGDNEYGVFTARNYANDTGVDFACNRVHCAGSNGFALLGQCQNSEAHDNVAFGCARNGFQASGDWSGQFTYADIHNNTAVNCAYNGIEWNTFSPPTFYQAASNNDLSFNGDYAMGNDNFFGGEPVIADFNNAFMNEDGDYYGSFIDPGLLSAGNQNSTSIDPMYVNRAEGDLHRDEESELSEEVGSDCIDPLTLTWSVENTEFFEGTGEGDDDDEYATVTFAVNRELPAPLFMTVMIEHGDTNSEDFDGAPFLATIPFDSEGTEFSIPVSVYADEDEEEHETFTLRIVKTTMMNLVVDAEPLELTVLNDDVGITVTGVQVIEPNGENSVTAHFPVTLSGPVGEDVYLYWHSENGSANGMSIPESGVEFSEVGPYDFQNNSGELVIPAGETEGMIDITVFGDSLDELNETFFVSIDEWSLGFALDTEAEGVIVDNDTVGITVADLQVNEPEGGSGFGSLSVHFSTQSDRWITINYSTLALTATAGSDYVADLNHAVEIPPFYEGDYTIELQILGDESVEGSETFRVRINSATNASVTDGTGIVTILDEDSAGLPTVSISDAEIAEGDDGETLLHFTVTLSEGVEGTVEVGYYTEDDGASTEDGDYEGAESFIEFPPFDTEENVTIVVNGDPRVEGDESFLVLLAGAEGAAILDGVATGLILNDDEAGIVVEFEGEHLSVSEDGGSDEFFVYLTSQPEADVTVDINVGEDLSTDPQSLTFTSENWNEGRTVDVNAVDDEFPEDPETHEVSFAVSSEDGNYHEFELDVIDVDVDDNDDDLFANAGEDAEGLPGLYFLTGQVTEGAEFEWAQVEGPTEVELLNANTLNPSFEASENGDYVFTLTAYLGEAEAEDTVIVTIVDLLPITIVFPNHATVLVDDELELNALESYDPNGTEIDGYEWSLEGDNPVESIEDVLNDDESGNPVFSSEIGGVFHLRLVVFSEHETSEPSFVTVIVFDFEGEVVPPAANAGPEQVAELNTLVTLNGHDSIDPDSGDRDEDMTFDWNILYQPDGADIDLSSEGAVRPTFTPSVPGLYVFQLVVNDSNDDGLDSAPAYTAVFVFDDVNLPPIAMPAFSGFDDGDDNDTLNPGEEFGLNGDDSYDPEEENITYHWEQLSGPAIELSPNGNVSEVSGIAPVTGTYVFELVVNDGNSDSEPVEIVVTVLDGDESAPVAVALSNDENPRFVSVPVPAPVELDGSDSTGPDGSTTGDLTFQWEQILGPTILIENATSEDASFEPMGSQTYGFRLTVTSPSGASDTDELLIAISTFDANLNPTGNDVPRAIVVDVEEGFTNEAVFIDCRDSFDNPFDPDGAEDENDLIFMIRQTCGPLVTITEVSPGRFFFVPEFEGTYCFEVRVDDGNDISPPVEFEVPVTEDAGNVNPPVFGGGGGGGGAMDWTTMAMLAMLAAIVWLRKRQA